jgi:hypothetical protein
MTSKAFMTTSIQTINDKGIDLDDGIAACRRPNWRRAVVYCLKGHAASPAPTSRSTRYALQCHIAPHRRLKNGS